jgi:hypothetical protein
MNSSVRTGLVSLRKAIGAAVAAVCITTAAFAQTPPGAGCTVGAANAATGADVPETYFGPPPSTVQK